jgi:D-glycero-D-manno-heptose 1,7-bisphosphate phosphatase
MGKRFVALDRDGTIIKKYHYLSDPDLVELLPGAAAGLRRLQVLGLGLIVVTNQSPIGRGYFDENRLGEIHQRLEAILAVEGVVLDGIYYCPHTPEDHCPCRKPRPGMLHLAAKALNFEVKDCFMIGDNASDIEAGQQVGAATFLVKTGDGPQVIADQTANPDYIVDDLAKAALMIEKLMTDDKTQISKIWAVEEN